MTIQSATTVDIRLGWQPSRGVLATSLRSIPKVSCSLAGTIEALESNRIRADRMRDDMGDGMESCAGDLNDELAIGDHDDLLEATLGGTWTPGPTASGSMDFGPGGSITRSGGWPGFFRGDVVDVSGSDNDGRYRIKSIASNAAQMIDDSGELADFVVGTESGVTVAVVGQRLVNGKSRRFATVEIYRPEISGDQYEVFEDVELDGMSISITPQGLATIRYPLMGRKWYLNGTALDAVVDETDSGALLAAVNGAVFLDGEKLELITNLDITIANGTSGEGVVGSKYRAPTVQGRTNASASFTALVDSDRFARKHRAREHFDLVVELEGGGHFLRIALPYCKSRSMQSTTQGEGSITVNGDLQALRDPTMNAMIVLQKSNA